MGEVTALEAKSDGTELASTTRGVEEVVKEFIASHTASVPTLKAEEARTFLEDCVPINTSLAISGADKMLTVLTELDMRAGPIKPLDLNEGTIDDAEQVGLLVSGHCY